MQTEQKTTTKSHTALVVVCLLGLVQQVLILAQSAGSPWGTTPHMDADVYWRWAARIAQGTLTFDEPFQSAPLYPYLVGGVRALGGGLTVLYGVQVALHLLTAYLIGSVSARRFGCGWQAAALYLLLADPAYYTGRVLNCTLQAFAVTCLWVQLSSFAERPTLRRATGAGLLAGLATLAYPPLLLGLPLLVAWIGWRTTRGRRLAATALAGVAAALAIAPATLHNWRASGEFIPVSAQSGLTFFHGNHEGATGTYHRAAGLSDRRENQNSEALALVRRERGPDAGYNDVSAYFFDRGLEWWREDPLRTARLFASKLWWFLSGRVYGDIYMPYFERRTSAPALWLAPLPVAWIALLALAALGLRRTSWRDDLPAWLLALLPLLIVCVFWYSPRYRAPALPLLAGSAALALQQAWQVRRSGRTPWLGLALLVIGIGSSLVNRHVLQRDDPRTYLPKYQATLANLHLNANGIAEAQRLLEQAVAGGFDPARVQLADIARRRGDHATAIEQLTSYLQVEPNDLAANKTLAVTLAEKGEFERSLPLFAKVIELDPSDAETLSNWGNALLGLGRPQEAQAHYEASLALRPDVLDTHYNLALCLNATGATEQARERLEHVLEEEPRYERARRELIGLFLSSGQEDRAVALLRAGLAYDGEHVGMRDQLAWLLATAPSGSAEQAREALTLAQAQPPELVASDPQLLDTLAAAQAATGDFAGAGRTLAEALQLLAERDAPQAYRSELAQRAQLYARGAAYRRD